MDSTFIGVLNENELIVRNNISELRDIPSVSNLYFEKIFDHEGINDYKEKVSFFHFVPINIRGEKTNIAFGNFEIIEISPDVSYRWGKFKSREILILDKEKNVVRTYISTTQGDDFILKEILFLINTLSKISDWEIFCQYKSFPIKLKRKENEINFLKKKIQELTQLAKGK